MRGGMFLSPLFILLSNLITVRVLLFVYFFFVFLRRFPRRPVEWRRPRAGFYFDPCPKLPRSKNRRTCDLFPALPPRRCREEDFGKGEAVEKGEWEERGTRKTGLRLNSRSARSAIILLVCVCARAPSSCPFSLTFFYLSPFSFYLNLLHPCLLRQVWIGVGVVCFAVGAVVGAAVPVLWVETDSCLSLCFLRPVSFSSVTYFTFFLRKTRPGWSASSLFTALVIRVCGTSAVRSCSSEILSGFNTGTKQHGGVSLVSVGQRESVFSSLRRGGIFSKSESHKCVDATINAHRYFPRHCGRLGFPLALWNL